MSLIDIQRIDLTNGVSRAVAPPCYATRAQVINITGAALRVYSTEGDDDAYLEITDGYQQPFEFRQPALGLPTQIAFYLLAGASGEAVILWR